MAEVIPQITVDSSKVKNTWVQNEVVTNDVYNAINKAVIDLKNNNNLLDTNAILFREQYNSSSKNLNNAIHQGIYSFTSSAVNAPSGVSGGNLFVTNTSKINQGSSVITQIAFCHNGAVYARTKNNSENFTAWNKLAYITDNVASATKATQDSQGQQINTTYMKKVSGTGENITLANDDFGGQLTIKRNSTNATTVKFTNTSSVNRYVGFTGQDKTMYKWGDSGENQTAFLDESNYNNYAPTKTGGGASGTWGINISGTAAKATKDSQGNTINTTYMKKVSGTGENITLANDNFGGQLTIKRNSTYAATVKFTNTSSVNRYVGFTGQDKTMYKWGDSGENQTAFLDESNYNNYAPTKTGGGASGTWGINISGNAKVLSETYITGNTSGVNLPFGITWSTILNNNFPCNYGNCLSIKGSGAIQIAVEWVGTTDATAGRMFFRNARDISLGSWSPWREIAYTTGNIASADNATKATQDKKGRDITGYLYKTEDLYLNASADIVATGNITEILNSFCTKFKNIQGTSSYVENPPTTLKSLNDNKAPKASPAFSGTPTAPTPSTSDNSTRIATTAFVKSLFTASKTTNGWHKEASTGLIWQWGTVQGVGGGKLYNFPISFPNAVLGCASNRATRSSSGAVDGNSAGIVINNKSSFYAYDDDGSNNVNYIAVGY